MANHLAAWENRTWPLRLCTASVNHLPPRLRCDRILRSPPELRLPVEQSKEATSLLQTYVSVPLGTRWHAPQVPDIAFLKRETLAFLEGKLTLMF